MLKNQLWNLNKLALVLFMAVLGSVKAHAVCPVCTVAVGAGVGISRWLGIDDSVAGLWVGGLLMSSSFWMADWLEKKKLLVHYSKAISFVIVYGLTFIPLIFFTDIIGHPFNTLWGVDKLILGSFIGSVLFVGSVYLDTFFKKSNQGKVYIYYQKVIIPVVLLLVFSIIFYIITS